MDIIVKNCPISKTYISKLSYNATYNILACNIDGNDTIQFYTFHSDSMTFQQVFKGQSRPSGSKNCIKWSSDGKYLLLGTTNIQIWQFIPKTSRIIPLKTYQQDFIEIKQISWNSSDNLSYAIGGINKSNTIRIRNIQTEKTKQLPLKSNLTMSSISFDPYGKYLFVLLRNNIIEIYSLATYKKQKQIQLSPAGLKINPIREIREMSWSPDYMNFICPSLDDNRLNIAMNMSRNKDFQVSDIFIGHCSTISCASFSPKLYRGKDGRISSIVALGDSSGNISIWRLYNSFGGQNEKSSCQSNEPLLLSNSIENSYEVVEELEWDMNGEFLMANMMKKYIHLIRFDKKKDFGQELTDEENFELIQKTYGARRGNQVNAQNIEVFNGFETANLMKANDRGIPNTHLLDNKQKNQPMEIQQEVRNDKPLENGQQKNQDKIIEEQQQVKAPNESINHSEINQPQQFKTSNSSHNNPVNAPIPQKTPTPNQSQAEHPSAQVIPNQPQQAKLPTISEHVDFVKLSEQKTFVGRNNRKKIQPAMLVRKDQLSNTNGPQSSLNHTNPNNTINPFNQMATNSGVNPQNPFLPQQSNSNTTYFSNEMLQSMPSLELSPITFNKKSLKFTHSKTLHIKKLSSKATSLMVSTNNSPVSMGEQGIINSEGNSQHCERIFPSQIQHLEIHNERIYVLNEGYLYVFNEELQPLDLPLKIGEVHKMSICEQTQPNNIHQSQELSVYYISTDGYLFGFTLNSNRESVKTNHKSRCLTPIPIPLHILLLKDKKAVHNASNNESVRTQSQVQSNLCEIVQFNVTYDGNIFIAILQPSKNLQEAAKVSNQLSNQQTDKILDSKMSHNKPKEVTYIYDKQKHMWVRMTYNNGKYVPGFSIKMAEDEQKLAQHFFHKICPSLAAQQRQSLQFGNQNFDHKTKSPILTNSAINSFEEKLIYYKKYQKSDQKYLQCLIQYMKHLKENNSISKLRKSIHNYFFNAQSGVYLEDDEIRRKTYANLQRELSMGTGTSQILQEFSLLHK